MFVHDVKQTNGESGKASPGTLRALDWLNFFLADVQTGVGPFLAVYLATCGWDEQRVGIALMVGGIAGIATQIPAGGLADRIRAKRSLIAGGVVALALGSLIIAQFTGFWPVTLAQVVIGGTSSIFIPVICAISMGLVGHKMFDQRQGRNQAFNSAGNVCAALAFGLAGYYISNRSIFYLVIVLALPTLVALSSVRSGEIDYEVARGSSDGARDEQPAGAWALVRDRRLFTFLACAVLFHFANAALLPLLGELLGRGKGRGTMMFMAACVIATQLVIALIAGQAGRRAGTWGRKPLLLAGFAALVIRGLLYTVTHSAALLISIQVLDGVGAGIFNVVSVLVIADLTRGTGHFNLTLGVISMAVGIGASLSQFVAGSVVHHFGYPAGFLFLSLVASTAFAILLLFMPETLNGRAAEKVARA